MEKHRSIDLDDYDLTLDIHGHPTKNPPVPYQFKGVEEYDIIHDAHWIGVVRKDSPKDYTEYWQMWNEYKETTSHKRQITAYKRYKERLKTCKTKDDYLQALMDWNKEKNNN